MRHLSQSMKRRLLVERGLPVTAKAIKRPLQRAAREPRHVWVVVEYSDGEPVGVKAFRVGREAERHRSAVAKETSGGSLTELFYMEIP